MLRRYIMTGEEACLVGGGRKDTAAECLLVCASARSCEPKAVAHAFPEASQDTATATGKCSIEQIATMAKAGLSAEQIKAACE